MSVRPLTADLRPRSGMRLDNGPSHQFGPSVQDPVLELQTKVGALRRDNALLLTQLARAVKCLNAVSAENQLLRTEIASLLPSRLNQAYAPWSCHLENVLQNRLVQLQTSV